MENWTKLFGSPADCECEDCKSVFSPAAYLVDILQFLDNCPRNAAGNNPLDLLLGRPRNSTDPIQLAGRRPDIGFAKTRFSLCYRRLHLHPPHPPHLTQLYLIAERHVTSP